jgi:hypothetical protein
MVNIHQFPSDKINKGGGKKVCPTMEDSLAGENGVLATLRCPFAVDDDERNRFNKAPNTVDFGTASHPKFRDTKQPVFSAAGCGGNHGFWHSSGRTNIHPLIKGDPSKRIDDIENVETVFKAGIGYDSKKLIDSVRGQVGIR